MSTRKAFDQTMSTKWVRPNTLSTYRLSTKCLSTKCLSTNDMQFEDITKNNNFLDNIACTALTPKIDYKFLKKIHQLRWRKKITSPLLFITNLLFPCLCASTRHKVFSYNSTIFVLHYFSCYIEELKIFTIRLVPIVKDDFLNLPMKTFVVNLFSTTGKLDFYWSHVRRLGTEDYSTLLYFVSLDEFCKSIPNRKFQ